MPRGCLRGSGEPAWGGDVRANRAYELIVSRGGLEPAFLADRDRLDRIEVVSIDDGEVVLYWDLPAKEASRVLKLLRADLVTLEAAEFIDTWRGADE
jgi:hypothetical protein